MAALIALNQVKPTVGEALHLQALGKVARVVLRDILAADNPTEYSKYAALGQQ